MWTNSHAVAHVTWPPWWPTHLDKLVGVLEAGEDLGEDLCSYHHLCQIHAVLGDLAERAADLALELGVLVDHQGCQVGNGTGVDNCLRQLGRVLGNVAEGGRADALEAELRLLHAEHEQRHRTGVHHLLRQLRVVAGDVAQRPRGGLLDPGIELLQAGDERVQAARVDDSLRQLWRVLRNSPQAECGCLLVEAVLLAQRIHLCKRGTHSLINKVPSYLTLANMQTIAEQQPAMRSPKLLPLTHQLR